MWAIAPTHIKPQALDVPVLSIYYISNFRWCISKYYHHAYYQSPSVLNCVPCDGLVNQQQQPTLTCWKKMRWLLEFLKQNINQGEQNCSNWHWTILKMSNQQRITSSFFLQQLNCSWQMIFHISSDRIQTFCIWLVFKNLIVCLCYTQNLTISMTIVLCSLYLERTPWRSCGMDPDQE